MKDNTLLPGEWCGGQLHPHPLAQSGDTKSYKIVLMVGADRHEIEIMQGNAQYRGGGMEQLIEAAFAQAQFLRERANTGDDHGACVSEKEAETWEQLAQTAQSEFARLSAGR